LTSAALVVGAYGCGDSDSTDSTGGSAGSGGSGGSDSSPVYALVTQIFGESEQTSYVLLADSLVDPTELSLDDALVEISGRAVGAGPDGGGVLFIASDLGSEVTRYRLDGDKLVESGRVSFLNKGVQSFGEYGSQFQFISDNKAYWFDRATVQVVVWNPTDMTVSGSIPLHELVFPNEKVTFTSVPIHKGNMLYTFVGWRRGDTLQTMPTRTAVIAIDTTTDEASIVMKNACANVRDGYLADDGYIYMATESYGTAAYTHNHADAPAPCLLRFDTESGTFDDDYDQALNDLLGVPTGTLVVGENKSVFLRWLDEAAVPPGTDDARKLSSAPAWGWAKLTVGDTPTAAKIEVGELTGGRTLPFVSGSHVFIPAFEGQASTTFNELSEAGSFERGVKTPGLVFSVAKLR